MYVCMARAGRYAAAAAWEPKRSRSRSVLQICAVSCKLYQARRCCFQQVMTKDGDKSGPRGGFWWVWFFGRLCCVDGVLAVVDCGAEQDHAKVGWTLFVRESFTEHGTRDRGPGLSAPSSQLPASSALSGSKGKGKGQWVKGSHRQWGAQAIPFVSKQRQKSRENLRNGRYGRYGRQQSRMENSAGHGPLGCP